MNRGSVADADDVGCFAIVMLDARGLPVESEHGQQLTGYLLGFPAIRCWGGGFHYGIGGRM